MPDPFCEFEYETDGANYFQWQQMGAREDEWSSRTPADCRINVIEMMYTLAAKAQWRNQSTANGRVGNSRYTFSDQRAQEFVAQNPDVEKALLAALPVIDEVLGERTRLTLVIAPDSENSIYDRLMCYMKPGASVDEALSQLSTFRQAWRHLPDRATDKLSFTVEAE